MHCKKCGHELSDGDIFCSRCGTKIFDDSSTQADEKSFKERRLARFVREKLQQLSIDRNFAHQQIRRFLFCLAACVLISLILYAISPNEPYASNADRVNYIFSMLLLFPLFTPLMIALFILQEKSYWIEFLFSFMLLTEIDCFVVKSNDSVQIVVVVALFIGLFMLIVIACRNIFNR